NFRTDLRPIETELIIDRTTSDQWWVSKNNRYGFMGSVFVSGLESPDFIYFANWKRLNEARWKPDYVPGRNFSSLPLSVKDSAVCYFMDVGRLERWQKRQMTVLLAAEDLYGFDYNKVGMVTAQQALLVPDAAAAAGPPELPSAPQVPQVNQNVAQAQSQTRGIPQGSVMLPIGPIRVDIQTLRALVGKVDEYIFKGTPVTEEELRGMENVLQQLKFRYPYGSMY
ncbi:MAG: hypothetical protein LBC72_04075, partial [Spirochaetaceae bacterium]|nr:hypothetical protein [Spirochaetaceae bacterium]